MKQRNITIDILKVIGIICIILAHVCESKVVFQLRNFDVPLMVICSAYLYKEQQKLDRTFLRKFAKRIIRLVVPVWIFFTVFFLLKFICSQMFHCDFYNMKQIIKTYLLIDGVGYVWIFRVYILAAIALPIFYFLKNKINNKNIFSILIISIYVIYEILYLFFGESSLFLKYIIYYIIPYGLLCSLIALKLKENKKLFLYCIVFFLIFVVNLVFLYLGNSDALMTNAWKYPPRIYYLSYAFAIVLLLWIVIENKNIFNIKEKLNCKLVTFISSHTMWIYLWHILFLELVPQHINWILRFCIVGFSSILITFIQSMIIRKSNIKNKLLLSVLDS